jgi:hypothetical protein
MRAAAANVGNLTLRAIFFRFGALLLIAFRAILAEKLTPSVTENQHCGSTA